MSSFTAVGTQRPTASDDAASSNHVSPAKSLIISVSSTGNNNSCELMTIHSPKSITRASHPLEGVEASAAAGQDDRRLLAGVGKHSPTQLDSIGGCLSRTHSATSGGAVASSDGIVNAIVAYEYLEHLGGWKWGIARVIRHKKGSRSIDVEPWDPVGYHYHDASAHDHANADDASGSAPDGGDASLVRRLSSLSPTSTPSARRRRRYLPEPAADSTAMPAGLGHVTTGLWSCRAGADFGCAVPVSSIMCLLKPRAAMDQSFEVTREGARRVIEAMQQPHPFQLLAPTAGSAGTTPERGSSGQRGSITRQDTQRIVPVDNASTQTQCFSVAGRDAGIATQEAGASEHCPSSPPTAELFPTDEDTKGDAMPLSSPYCPHARTAFGVDSVSVLRYVGVAVAAAAATYLLCRRNNGGQPETAKRADPALARPSPCLSSVLPPVVEVEAAMPNHDEHLPTSPPIPTVYEFILMKWAEFVSPY